MNAYTVEKYLGKWTVFAPGGAATAYRYDDREIALDMAWALNQARNERKPQG